MYENFAWEQFLITGNVETFMEYKRLIALSRDEIYDKKDGILNETYQSERDSNKRSSL